jgi:hypothetical protein
MAQRVLVKFQQRYQTRHRDYGIWLPLIATIKLKETTASDLFRWLNFYSKQYGLYQAIKAFGQILKSLSKSGAARSNSSPESSTTSRPRGSTQYGSR